MLRRISCLCIIPASQLNPLSPLVPSFSLVGAMVQDIQDRTIKEEYTLFFEQLSTEEQIRIFKENTHRYRSWMETAIALRDIDVVSRLVKFVRENSSVLHSNPMSGGLVPYYYHCLLRVFTLHRDFSSLEQLLQVMEARAASDPMSSLINSNTLAWVMWVAHRCDDLFTLVRAFQLTSHTRHANSQRVLEKESEDYLFADCEGIACEASKTVAPTVSMMLYIVSQCSAPMAGLISKNRTHKELEIQYEIDRNG